MTRKLTIGEIMARKGSGERISMLTAYDAPFARLLDDVGIDILLVGDSLGNVLLGHASTVPVTMDDMLHHARAAGRGVRRSLLVGDLPFLSYQVSVSRAIDNAGRFLKEAGCDAVKLEGGIEVCETVTAMVRAGIPVMGHIGLTPQTASQLGGFKVQGRDRDSARRLLKEAAALEAAGVFSLVLECIPGPLAGAISEAVGIPTIGIGAGPDCDGQVLVTHDLLGMFEKPVPSFVKKYVDLAPRIREAVTAFRDEVRSGDFPSPDRGFAMQIDVRELLGD